MRWRTVLTTSMLAVLVTMASAGEAAAGQYTVNGACGNWGAYTTDATRFDLAEACPGLVVQNKSGPLQTGPNQFGRWTFGAPPGTTIAALHFSGSMQGGAGWVAQGGRIGGSGGLFADCRDAACGLVDYPGGNATEAYVQVVCLSDVCANDARYGHVSVSNVRVDIDDPVAPTVRITGGDATNAGWLRAARTVAFDAADNAGVSSVRVLLDADEQGTFRYACDYGRRIPCGQGAGTQAVNTARLRDGRHTLSVQAVDAAGNASSQAVRTVWTDNTAPVAPERVTLDGTPWRTTDRLSVSWSNPAQDASPIGGAVVQFCPLRNTPTDERGCFTENRTGKDLAGISDLKFPGPGGWRMRLWLRDEAGNQDRTTAWTEEVGQDTDAPQLAFMDESPDDPARLRIRATDATSGIARGEVEYKRRTAKKWRPLPAELSADGFTAFMDDSRLRNGTYELRARAFDKAGNGQGSDRRENGKPATVTVPIRINTRLVVGRRTRRGYNTRPRLRYGRALRLHGRLSRRGRRPIAGAGIEVWSQLKLPGAKWHRIGRTTTSRTGRFSFRARRGPARRLSFRYPGTRTIRGRVEHVRLRVSATTTLRADRRRTVNGGSVTFRGRLRGGRIPPTGKLVELQVFTRGRWRTFAQPRASSRTGRWAFRYRFEAVRGRVIFRFRARVRREADYPFELGVSRQVHVRVRGV